jgi:hypothetical protein
VILFWSFVIAMFSFILSFSVIVLLACLVIVPIALFHCIRASDVEISFAGLRRVVFFSFMWIGVLAWSAEIFG